MRLIFSFCILTVFFASCTDDDIPVVSIETPETYEFVRDGQSTVSFSGQTTRIKMAQELIDQVKSTSTLDTELALEMFRNAKPDGSDADPFLDTELNQSTKSVKSKTAASSDYFSANTAEGEQYKSLIEDWIDKQVNLVNANSNNAAAAGLAGQILDGSSVRYVSAKGIEYNQLINKTLIGSLMLDQMLNNYLGETVLDGGSNIEENTNKVNADGSTYTNMEHKWDEAFGYLFGNSDFPSTPLLDLGNDSFLNKYLSRVEGDDDFAGIAQDVFDALALGRAAIVENDYMLRDEQASILKEELSKVIAIRAVYYLQQGKNNLTSSPVEWGAMFHDLSEGIGFVYSLRFTQNPDTGQTYFTKDETDQMVDLLIGSSNGLWDLSSTTLDLLSSQIADRFDFTVDQAGS